MGIAGGHTAPRNVSGRLQVIPKILVQTWRDARLPAASHPFCEGWKRLNPDFEYRFYDDTACLALVKETAPHLVDAYRQFPYPVMRADFFRYAAIYRHGGVYADIDMECTRPVGPLLELAPVVLAVEAHLTERRRRELGYPQPTQIANCILLGQAGHPLFLEAMERSVTLWLAQGGVAKERIEDVTGPRMFTRLFHERPRTDVAVLRQMVLTPPRHYPDIWPINTLVHARHHFFGSWKSPTGTSIVRRWIERDLWPNPFGTALLDTGLSGASVRCERNA